jgi:hypothetical protein
LEEAVETGVQMERSERRVITTAHHAAQIVSEVAGLRLPHRSVMGEDDSSGVEGL